MDSVRSKRMQASKKQAASKAVSKIGLDDLLADDVAREERKQVDTD